MATNNTYAFEVNSIGRDVEINWYENGDVRLGRYGTLNFINQANFIEGISKKIDIGGIFFGSVVSQNHNLSIKYFDYISEIYISNVDWHSSVWNINFAPYQITAHELYFHGYGLLIGNRKIHNSYKDISSEILKTGRH